MRKAWVIVAHPDDETLFFGGLILTERRDWTVVVCTDGNADGLGSARLDRFRLACQKLGVLREPKCLYFRDDYSARLPQPALLEALKNLGVGPRDEVYTHGPFGEYGHPHHQDVCYGVHKAFSKSGRKVWSAAHNTTPTKLISLNSKAFQKKSAVLWDIYDQDVAHFLSDLPCTFAEGFVQVDVSEVACIYSSQTGIPVNPKQLTRKLKTYRWLIPWILKGFGTRKQRPF